MTADSLLAFTFKRWGLKSHVYVFLWLNLYLVPSYWQIMVCRVLSTSQSETLKRTSLLVQQESKWKPTKNTLMQIINLLLCSKSSSLHFFNLQKGKLQFAARWSAITAGHAVLKYHSNVNSSLTQLVQFYHWASV